jgi:hypothetical protein
VTAAGDRKIGAVFGLLGAVLFALAGLLQIAQGIFDLAVRHGPRAASPFDQALILLVVALIVGFFAVLGGLRAEGHAIVSGVVMIVLAIVGWLVLGLGSGVLGLLGVILMVVSGVVFLASGR